MAPDHLDIARAFPAQGETDLEPLLLQLGEAVRRAQQQEREASAGDSLLDGALLKSSLDTMLFVRNGMVEELLAAGYPDVNPSMTGGNPLYELKLMLASLNAICLHAAIEGGLPITTALTISNELIERIRWNADEDELRMMIDRSAIPLSYCIFVRDMLLPSISDKTLVRAASYIVEHYHAKITVSEVAQHVGLSSEYLSAKFKSEVGMSISAFVTHLRIREAKLLLRYTDFAIVDIAMRLSFSSQSYFQTVFKKETGVTPQQFRISSREGGGA